jgi:hypothetical protein
MFTRYVAMHFESANINPEKLKSKLTDSSDEVEVYPLSDGPDVEDQVEFALLTDLVRPLKLAFVGGDVAKRLAAAYFGMWVKDTPAVNDELLAFWGTGENGAEH